MSINSYNIHRSNRHPGAFLAHESSPRLFDRTHIHFNRNMPEVPVHVFVVGRENCRMRRFKTIALWPTLKCRLTLRLWTKGPEEAISQVHLRCPTSHQANAC